MHRESQYTQRQREVVRVFTPLSQPAHIPYAYAVHRFGAVCVCVCVCVCVYSLQVVLLGAVSTIFPQGAAAAAPLAGADGSEGAAAQGNGWDQMGSIALTFLYLFFTSLALGAATGMGISCLVVRFAAHGPHHVSQHTHTHTHIQTHTHARARAQTNAGVANDHSVQSVLGAPSVRVCANVYACVCVCVCGCVCVCVYTGGCSHRSVVLPKLPRC